MKTKFLKTAAVFALGLAAMVACDQEIIEPSFPEPVTKSDVKTELEKISFTANYDWELSVPQELIGYFWLLDEDGNKQSKISGTQGEYTIQVGITDEPDFENDITCKVTLKMGDEERVVATYTLLKSVREFKAYACKIGENGELLYKSEGGFDYADVQTTEVELVYSSIYGYVMPLSVEAGFNYDIVTPEWIVIEKNSDQLLGRRGTWQVRIVPDLDRVTALPSEGTIDVYPRNAAKTEANKVASISVKLDNMDSYVICDMAVAAITAAGKFITYDENGEAEENSSVTVNVQAASELTYVLAGLVNGWWASSVNTDPYYTYSNGTVSTGEATGSGIVKTYPVAVSFSANEATAERTAYLFAMPSEVAATFDNWCSTIAPENAPLPEEYEKYLLTTFTQAGQTPVVVEGEKLVAEGAEMSLMDSTNEICGIVQNAFGNIPVYEVNATSQFSLASETDEIWNMEIYDSSMELNNELFAGEFFEGALKLSATEETYGLVIFYTGEANTAFAAAWITYIPSSTPVLTIPFEFVNPDAVSGAALDLAESDDIPADLAYQGIPATNIYVLTYTGEPTSAEITVPSMPDWEASYGNVDSTPTWWLTYTEKGENSIEVNMTQAGEVDFFTFTVGSAKYALVCTKVASAGGDGDDNQGGAAVIDPTQIITLSSGNATITAMNQSSELYQTLSSNLGTTNLMTIECQTNIFLMATEAYPFNTVEQFGMDFNASSTFTMNVQTNMAMIMLVNIQDGTEGILVFKNNGSVVAAYHLVVKY